MTYPQQGGYPQPFPQQPYHPGPSGGANPATAVIAGILAILIAVFEGVVLGYWFSLGSLGDMPGQVVTVVALEALVALVLLIGAIMMFARKTAGAVLTIVGAVIAAAGVLLEPVMLGIGRYGRYMEALFQLDTAATLFRVLTLFAAPVVLILAVLPPTFKYLRSSRGSHSPGYPVYGAYPPPPPGYPMDPNSGGFAQPGYPVDPNSGAFPQQGYPQQQQGGGYPQQPGW